MCSICGGTTWDLISEHIWNESRDRGRDDEGKFVGEFGGWIGNHRATPTTEVLKPIERQPVGIRFKVVFNGIISNDKLLNVKEGEADTSVLPRVLNFFSLKDFRNSIEEKLVGSYALAVLLPDGEIWLAANYKPIWLAMDGGDVYFSSLKSHFPEAMHPWRMTPYSVLRIPTFGEPESLPIRRTQSKKALVICSSGLDSTTVAAYAVSVHGPDNTTLIHFNYGCRATSQEILSVSEIAKYLKCNLEIIPMVNFGGSSLLDPDATLADGIAGAEYAHEWVPARNLMMLTHTVAYAEAKGFGHIYLGTNLEEAGAYPDNEEQFILDFNNLLYGAVQNGVKIEIHSPLGGLMKHEIIPFGMKYNTPYHLTWSCYRGGSIHCGHCGPDFMRRTAFKRNGLIDPVPYAYIEPNFWEGCHEL